MMRRRGLILTALAAPFIARPPGLLMPVKPVQPVPEAWPALIDGVRLEPGCTVSITCQQNAVLNGLWFVSPEWRLVRLPVQPGGVF